MPIEKRSLDEQLKNLPAAERWAGRGELGHLAGILCDGETVLALTGCKLYGRGYAAGESCLAAVTDRRLLFVGAGFLTAPRQAEVAFQNVTAVSQRAGLVQGSITLATVGGRIVIDRVPNADLVPVAGAIATRLGSAPPPPPQPTPAAPADIVSQLERLARLREQGALTQQEFEAAKARLLSH